MDVSRLQWVPLPHTMSALSETDTSLHSVCYSQGASSAPTDRSDVKIKKNDIVRFELDMDAGTLSLFINDKAKGVKFRNLQGHAIWPCVQFYSSNRQVRILRLEGQSMSATAQVPCVRLFDCIL